MQLENDMFSAGTITTFSALTQMTDQFADRSSVKSVQTLLKIGAGGTALLPRRAHTVMHEGYPGDQ
jgi:hypothetical protein